MKKQNTKDEKSGIYINIIILGQAIFILFGTFMTYINSDDITHVFLGLMLFYLFFITVILERKLK